MFAQNFSKNLNLDDYGIPLPVFPSRTNLNLHNTSIAHKMGKKVITNLDSSKASGPDCIPVVVLKNCEPELSCMLAKLFNMCLEESFFLDCFKVSSVVPVSKGCVCYIVLVCFVCLKESTCETKKNVFYFTSKALFVLEIIKF